MLPRRAVLAAPCVAALVACSAGWAQEAGRTYRLGFVVTSPRSEGFWTILFEELRRAGFVEGDNLQVVGEFGVTLDHADAVAAAVVKAGADVIFTAGPDCTRAMQRATKTIPISTYSGDLGEVIAAGHFGWLVRTLAVARRRDIGAPAATALTIDGWR
jgi:hypothetical protein